MSCSAVLISFIVIKKIEKYRYIRVHFSDKNKSCQISFEISQNRVGYGHIYLYSKMLLFLDLETTGFEKETDNILEISAVRYDEDKKEIVARFDRVLNLPAGVEVSPMIEGLTGISTQMCADEGISMEQAQEEFSVFIREDDIITGHNISFDTGFLNQYGFLDAEKFRHQEIDTFILSVLVLGQEEESHALEILSEKYGISHANAHRAMSDVLANLEFYRILERIYARNFSENFQKFLEKHEFSFEEKYFFDSVFAKKDALMKEALPEISKKNKKSDIVENSHGCSLRENSQNPEISEKTKIFSEKFLQSQNCFYETFAAEKHLLSLLSAAEISGKKISLFYPEKQKEEFFASFQNLQNDFSNLQFFAPRDKMVSEKKFQKFLEKTSFDRSESIVAAKVFRSQEMGQELFVRFMGPEWIPARKILGQEEQDLSEISQKILPLSEAKIQKNQNEIRVFFGGEELENQLLEMEQDKIFSKRALQDFSPEKKPEISDILADLAESLRKEKGKNPYAIRVLWRELSKMDCFAEAQFRLSRFAEQEFSDQEKMHVDAWLSFFTEPADDEIKILELFPDNQLSIDTINPFFENSFTKMCSANESTFFFGKSFPHDFSGKISFSFPLPSEFSHIQDERFFPKEVFFPEISRDATPQEMANLILSQWEKNPEKNIIVSLTSQKNISETKEFLREKADELGIKMFTRENGGRGKIRKMMQKHSKKVVLGNTKFLESLELSLEDFSSLLVHKVQFDHPKQLLIQAQRKRFYNDFEEFSLPRAIARLERDIFAFSEKPEGKNLQVFLGEGRIADDSTFYAKLQNVFPEKTEMKKWSEA